MPRLIIQTNNGFDILELFGPKGPNVEVIDNFDAVQYEFDKLVQYNIANPANTLSGPELVRTGTLTDVFYGIDANDPDLFDAHLELNQAISIPITNFMGLGHTSVPGLFYQGQAWMLAYSILNGNDSLYGGGGGDTLNGYEGNDLIIGNGGDDVLWGGGGNNVIMADNGNDTVIVGNNDSGVDQIELGRGNDILIPVFTEDRAGLAPSPVSMVADFSISGGVLGRDIIDTTSFFDDWGIDPLAWQTYFVVLEGTNGLFSWSDVYMRSDESGDFMLVTRLLDVSQEDAVGSLFYAGQALYSPPVPTIGLAAGGSVDENALAGTRVGRVAVTNGPAGLVTYMLTEDPSGFFQIDENTGVIRVAPGAMLDYEASASHQVTVRVLDFNGVGYDGTFTIGVRDLPETNVAGSVKIGGFSFNVEGGLGGRTLSSAIAGDGAIPVGADVRIGFRADGETFKIEGTAANPLNLRLTEEAGIEKIWARHIASADIDLSGAAGRREVWVRDTTDAEVRTGAGNDRVALDADAMAGPSTVKTGAGDDFVGIRNIGSGVTLQIDLGSGDDRLIIRGSSNDVINGGAGRDTLDGGDGVDLFVMQRGQIEGDWIKSFSGEAEAGLDKLVFVGWSSDMTLEHKGGGRYLATDSDGWSELFYLRQYQPLLTAGDWLAGE